MCSRSSFASLVYLAVCSALIALFPKLLFAETEPNNDSASANPITLNASGAGGSSGTLSTTDLDDWYSVTIPSDGALYAETNSDAALEIDDYMFDMANGHLEALASYDISTGTKESTHKNNVKAGTYLVKAHRYSGAGAYTISVQFTPSPLVNDAEPNDTFPQALVLDTNKSATGHLGYFGAGVMDLADWWKITIGVDGKLGVKTTSDSTLDIDLYLYDRNGQTQLASYDTSTGIHEGTHFNYLTPGTYYVKASRYSGYGSYTITNLYTPTKLANDVEPNDSAVNAVTLAPNSSLTGHSGYQKDGVIDLADWYKITTP
jgi:hypothetical protein